MMLARLPEAQTWPPDYLEIVKWRNAQLMMFQEKPWMAAVALHHYKTKSGPVAFISHWCTTYDPRNAGRFDAEGAKLPTKMPFYLFRRQEELVEFLWACFLAEENGLLEKCRDMGATWVCAAFSVFLWLLFPGVAIGWGSRKEMLVDTLGDPDSIFEKMRILIRNLPPEFLPRSFVADKHMTFMKIVNPENGATITGESGDNIGRGGRKRVYFKDESSHYERPEKIEAALGDNTRVQFDISSVNGTGNVFYRRRKAGVDWEPGRPLVSGRTQVFVMDWRDHPAKNQEWYDKRKKKAEDDGLLHVFEQEVNRNYSASVEGVIIPGVWVQSAIDAHIKLSLDTTGPWIASLDVADEGGDTNALAHRKGIVLRHIEEWGDRDTGETTRKAVASCAPLGRVELHYDCIGVGAGVKAEANRLRNEGLLKKSIKLVPWNAGAGVQDPKGKVIDGDDDNTTLINEDFYQNLSAQAAWSLRRRFELTHRAVTDPSFTWNVDDLISIPSTLPLLRKVEEELSQPTIKKSASMRLMVDKKPPGTRSPNLFDAIKMVFFPVIPYEPPAAASGTYGQGSR